jgi:DNA polymerase III alpha subunit
MKQNKFGEMIFNQSDVCDLLMRGRTLDSLEHMVLDDTVDLSKFPNIIDPLPAWSQQKQHFCSVPEFHQQQQANWHMPEHYKNFDIAAHVLSLCENQAQLQRCGEELLLFQERNLFDLLRYLRYLVDVMTSNRVIWGVGRGSCVSSYVLYKLQVHKIDSMFYKLDIREFLR